MPSRLQTSITCLVMSISARDGVASPDGWLWTRTQPVACSSMARRSTSRGYTGVPIICFPLALAETKSLRLSASPTWCVLQSVAPATLERIAPPICRGPWPSAYHCYLPSERDVACLQQLPALLLLKLV